VTYAQVFFRGLVIGVSIAAPVGPIAILCIKRSLSQGQLWGFVSGLGAATADAVYGCIAAFGLTFVSRVLVEQQVYIRILGGVFLLYLGVRTILKKTTGERSDAPGPGLIASYGSTFLLTLTNPMTILSFAAVFAGLGVVDAGQGYASASVIVCGVFTGSAAWWLTLSMLLGIFRVKFSSKTLRWVNRSAGIILCGFGVFAIVSVLL
jgi:threonine/homoserine/homoserine lactone efflux protein